MSTDAPARGLSRRQFGTLASPLVGMGVSRTWRGHGSAVFLELGDLHEDERGSLRGAASVMIQWSWRVEGPRSIRFGSWSGDRKISGGLNDLVGRSVTKLELEGRLPELVISLSGGRWVHSFMTAEGQPDWTLFLPDGSWLTVERGIVIHDRSRVDADHNM